MFPLYVLSSFTFLSFNGRLLQLFWRKSWTLTHFEVAWHIAESEQRAMSKVDWTIFMVWCWVWMVIMSVSLSAQIPTKYRIYDSPNITDPILLFLSHQSPPGSNSFWKLHFSQLFPPLLSFISMVQSNINISSWLA